MGRDTVQAWETQRTQPSSLLLPQMVLPPRGWQGWGSARQRTQANPRHSATKLKEVLLSLNTTICKLGTGPLPARAVPHSSGAGCGLPISEKVSPRDP